MIFQTSKRRREDIRHVAEMEEQTEMLNRGTQTKNAMSSENEVSSHQDDDVTMLARARLHKLANSATTRNNHVATTTSTGKVSNADNDPDNGAAAVATNALPEPLAGPVALDGDIFSQLVEVWDLLQTCVASEHVQLAATPRLEELGKAGVGFYISHVFNIISIADLFFVVV